MHKLPRPGIEAFKVASNSFIVGGIHIDELVANLKQYVILTH